MHYKAFSRVFSLLPFTGKTWEVLVHLSSFSLLHIAALLLCTEKYIYSEDLEKINVFLGYIMYASETETIQPSPNMVATTKLA